MIDNPRSIQYAFDFLLSEKVTFKKINAASYTCPHCDHTLELILTDEQGKVVERKVLPNKENINPKKVVLFTDGDGIPIDDEEVYSELKYYGNRLDATLMQGKCPVCGGLYCAIFLDVASRPVNNIVYSDGETSFLINAPVQSEYNKVYIPEFFSFISFPWIIERYVNAHLATDPDKTPCTIDMHIIGPFALDEGQDLAGPNGVSCCTCTLNDEQDDIWDMAQGIVYAVGPVALEFVES